MQWLNSFCCRINSAAFLKQSKKKWPFVGAKKYIRHILMGHEKVLKIFDGPQKIFKIFPFLHFFNWLHLKTLAKGVWAQNTQTGHQRDIGKTRHVKIQTKSTQVYIWQMVVKIQKDHFFMHFKADGEVCVIRDETKDTPLWQFFLSILYLFDSIFPGIVLSDKLHNFEERICFPNNGCHGKRKRKQFFTIIKFFSVHTRIELFFS